MSIDREIRADNPCQKMAKKVQKATRQLEQCEESASYLRTNRCMNMYGGTLLWVYSRKAYQDQLYLCATKKSIPR